MTLGFQELAVVGVACLAAFAFLAGWARARKGGELRLRHEVTVATPTGERTFGSVVGMDSYQTYNYGAGTSGWGAITCRLTGHALRVAIEDKDFFFLLTSGGTTSASTQIDLVKDFFGLPNATNDDSWVRQWQELAMSSKAVPLKPDQYPTIAVMPHGGWMDDAQVVSVDEAERRGLHITRYRLQITRDPIGPTFDLPLRPQESRKRGAPYREAFFVVDGTA